MEFMKYKRILKNEDKQGQMVIEGIYDFLKILKYNFN